MELEVVGDEHGLSDGGQHVGSQQEIVAVHFRAIALQVAHRELHQFHGFHACRRARNILEKALAGAPQHVQMHVAHGPETSAYQERVLLVQHFRVLPGRRSGRYAGLRESAVARRIQIDTQCLRVSFGDASGCGRHGRQLSKRRASAPLPPVRSAKTPHFCGRPCYSAAASMRGPRSRTKPRLSESVQDMRPRASAMRPIANDGVPSLQPQSSHGSRVLSLRAPRHTPCSYRRRVSPPTRLLRAT